MKKYLLLIFLIFIPFISHHVYADIPPLREAKIIPSNARSSINNIETTTFNVVFTPNINLNPGDNIRLLIPINYDLNKLDSGNINTYLTANNFSVAQVHLLESAISHDLLIKVASTLFKDQEYSFSIGSKNSQDFQFINPRLTNIYSFALQIEDSGNNILGKTYLKSAINEGITASGTLVSVMVGQYYFVIFGYSSPKALVTLEAINIKYQKEADSEGYFEFKKYLSPLSPQEYCLSAKDQLGRTSAPNCLPAFPVDRNVNIGPVIMPPTISLSASNYYMGDDVVLSGQTLPNTDVNLSLFVNENKSIINYLIQKFNLIKSAEAFYFPKLDTKSDSKGNFSIALPSNHADLYRLFAQANYDQSESPKSITLNVKILSIWMIILKFLLFLLLLIKSRLLEFIIITQIVVLIIYFLRRYLFHPHIIGRNRALALRSHLELTTEELDIVIKEKINSLANVNNM